MEANPMKKLLLLSMVTGACALYAKPSDSQKRLNESASVFEEIMAMNDKSIPQDLLDKAHCVVIVPGLKKGGFIVAAKYGKGYLVCRRKNGPGWGAPGTVRVEGGSVGFQIGGAETDVVMLVMNQRGAEKLLSSKFTLGAEGTVAAGPVGRDAQAQTDAALHAEILSYSRSRGVFAGIALQGATLREDLDGNEEIYGKKLGNKEIVDSGMASPAKAKKLIALLNKYSPKELKK
jgi:lipid-binding SYLF domain-containing protein